MGDNFITTFSIFFIIILIIVLIITNNTSMFNLAPIIRATIIFISFLITIFYRKSTIFSK